MPRTIILPLLISLLIGAPAIHSQTSMDDSREVWPEFTLNYDPIKKIRLAWAVRKETSDLTPEKTLETTVTFIYRVKPLVRDLLFDNDEHDNERKYMLSLAANYELTKSFGPSATSVGHKIMLDATPRYDLPGRILVQNRGRFEFRWTEGDQDFWFRDRLRVEHKFKIGKVRFRPYVSGEIIWTKSASAWDRNQVSGGVELTLVRKRAMVDMYFLRKNCDSCGFTDVNAMGVNLNLFFGKR